MITDAMTLTTRTDADNWAHELIQGQELNTPEQVADELGDWLWSNKPRPNCTYREHPIAEMDNETFLAMLIEYDGEQ